MSQSYQQQKDMVFFIYSYSVKKETCLASPLVTNTERGTNGTDSVVITISCSMNEIPWKLLQGGDYRNTSCSLNLQYYCSVNEMTCLGSLARTTTGRGTNGTKGVCSLAL